MEVENEAGRGIVGPLGVSGNEGGEAVGSTDVVYQMVRRLPWERVGRPSRGLGCSGDDGPAARNSRYASLEVIGSVAVRIEKSNPVRFA